MPALDGSQKFLISYAVLSFAYRGFILCVIVWGLYGVFEPYGLGNLAFAVALSVILGWTLPLINRGREFAQSIRRGRVDRFRAFVFALFTMSLMVALFFLPLPRTVRVPIVLEYGPALEVSAPRHGLLVPKLTYGDSVHRGELIAQLEDVALEKERLDLRNSDLSAVSIRLFRCQMRDWTFPQTTVRFKSSCTATTTKSCHHIKSTSIYLASTAERLWRT